MSESQPPAEHVVVFQLADEQYGIGIALVREIIRPPVITAVPRTPAYVSGVANLRGRVLPVLDLRLRFGLRATDEPPPAARVIVLEIDGVSVGAAVDAVVEVARIPQTAIEPPGATLVASPIVRLRGIATLGDRLVVLVDPRCIIEAAPATLRRAA